MKKINKLITSYLNQLQENWIIGKQLREFKKAPDDFLSSKVEGKTKIKNLVAELKSFDIPVQFSFIDLKDFKIWMKKFPKLVDFYDVVGHFKIEKILEHYISMKYLNIKKSDLIIDVAASSSPFAKILHQKKYNAYSQDLIYQTGIHNRMIGGSAGNLPLKNDSVDVMTLHCAFECFQGDSDINVIKEAQRVLKQRGRIGIIPLYLDEVYFVKTGPMSNKTKIKIEKNVRLIWRDDEFQKEPFSRHYSPHAFKYRILQNIKKLKYKIIFFENLNEIKKQFPDQKIYCHFLFKAVKN
ncbi:methyltransferase domain-containing protein [Candidatus Beckwithbacteria bacterium]|nr:methyltransferase domain-containing protein [Candidatus Beckwithbacteria bacterium]